MTGKKSVEAAAGLFVDTADGPRLLGSRCASCFTPYFPRSTGCHNPDCDDSKMEDATFGPRGTLWSVTFQAYQPPAPVVTPDPYTPYAVGIVDLPEGLRVLGRIATDDLAEIEVGSQMELVIESLGSDASGADVMSWQFKPVA